MECSHIVETFISTVHVFFKSSVANNALRSTNMHRICFFYLSNLFTNVNASEKGSLRPRMINDGDNDARGTTLFSPPSGTLASGVMKPEATGAEPNAEGHSPVRPLSFARKQAASARLLVSLAQTCAIGEKGSFQACPWPGTTYIPMGKAIQTPTNWWSGR